jgi:hypothetical protein
VHSHPLQTALFAATDNNVIQPDLSIGVPLADGCLAEIEHQSVSSAVKTLGSMTCPTGSSAVALGRMQQQGQEWVGRVKSRKLSYQMCDLWLTVNSGLAWGMASLTHLPPGMN